MSFFPELHTHSKNKIEAELDVSSYACVDTSNLADSNLILINQISINKKK